MSAEKRSASTRLTFKHHQRTCLLLVHPLHRLYFLVYHAVFNVRQDVGFGVYECVAVLAPPTSGWRNVMPELWRREE